MKAQNREKPLPGCLGRMVNLFDLSTGVAGNRMLADKPYQDHDGNSIHEHTHTCICYSLMSISWICESKSKVDDFCVRDFYIDFIIYVLVKVRECINFWTMCTLFFLNFILFSLYVALPLKNHKKIKETKEKGLLILI